MREWPGAVEADFETYYHLDIADLWRGTLTPRKAAVLLMHLPRGAAVWRHAGGPGAISDELEGIWQLEHTMHLQAWGKAPRNKRGTKPKMRPYPEPLFEADKKQAEFERNAAAFRRKHLDKD